jgi:hypothetical protein
VLRNVGYGFGVLTVAAIAAFWPSYLSRPLQQIDGTTHLHAAVMASWCALLVAQALLIRARATAWHRALGKLSYAIAPLVVIVALRLTQIRIRAVPAGALSAAARDFYLPISAALVFGTSYALAMAYRRRPALHARFMVGTALTFIDPVLARILAFHVPAIPFSYQQPITFGLTDAWLLFAIWQERRAGRRPGIAGTAFPALLGMFAVIHALWFTLAPTGAWVQLIAWFGALGLA